MRAAGPSDGRNGNNYRYQRHVLEERAKEERAASSKIWDDIYIKSTGSQSKSTVISQKDNKCG
jgi:hypothetical protein